MVTRTQDDILSMVERWVRHELPIINRGTEAHGDVQFVIARCQLYVEALAHATRETRDPETALRLLQLLAFAVSSVERHMQAMGGDPGEGVAALSVTGLLLRLGETADHAPRDSHETYWLQNRGDMPLTFTGSSREAGLIRLMRDVQHLNAQSAADLRPVCAGDMSITTQTAIEAMEFAARRNEHLTMQLHSFLAPTVKNCARSAMNFDVFAMTLHMYLCDYPVGVQMWPAPDPANIPGPMEMELVIGLADEQRCDMIRRRMQRLLPDDRARMQSAMQMPSLASCMAGAVGLTEDELSVMTNRQAAEHMSSHAGVPNALKAYAQLVNAAQTSGAYLGVIREHLETGRPASPAMGNRMPGPFDTLPQVVEMRRPHPSVSRLLAAANG